MSKAGTRAILIAVVFSAASFCLWTTAHAEDDRQPAPGPSARELTAQLKQGSLLFVAVVKQAKVEATTNSMPPSFLMEITFIDLKMLRGPAPAKHVFRYSTRDTAQPALTPGTKVIVSANETKDSRSILVIVEATDEDLKAAEAAK